MTVMCSVVNGIATPLISKGVGPSQERRQKHCRSRFGKKKKSMTYVYYFSLKIFVCFVRIICGLTQFTNKCHIAFAALEAVCFQTREVRHIGLFFVLWSILITLKLNINYVFMPEIYQVSKMFPVEKCSLQKHYSKYKCAPSPLPSVIIL